MKDNFVTMGLWFIQHIQLRRFRSDVDEETGESLVWSNATGWGTGQRTLFTAKEKEAFDLPIDGIWVEYRLTKEIKDE